MRRGIGMGQGMSGGWGNKVNCKGSDAVIFCASVGAVKGGVIGHLRT